MPEAGSGEDWLRKLELARGNAREESGKKGGRMNEEWLNDTENIVNGNGSPDVNRERGRAVRLE